MLIADMQYWQVFLFPSKKLNDWKPELIYSVIDSNAFKNRVLSTVWIQWHNSAVVADGVYIKSANTDKVTMFRYETALTTLEEHSINIPEEHMLWIFSLFKITNEMNADALRIRNRSMWGTNSEDDEYYSNHLQKLGPRNQLTMGEHTVPVTTFQRTAQPARPAKKTLRLVQVDVDTYLNN